VQRQPLKSSNPCGLSVDIKGVTKPLSSSRRHSLPKARIEDDRRRRLQRLLDSPMMQENDLGWTRQRQRAFIKSRIVAYGGTP
jgi:hypothetical protein